LSAEARRVRDKWRTKGWYSIVSPPYFNGVEIGSTPGGDPSGVIGRIIEITLYDITGDFSHQYLKLYFQVTDIRDSKADTIFKGHEYGRDYLRSLVRRGSTRIDGIFDLTTKDNYKMRISVVAFSAARVKTSQETTVRELIKKIAEEKAKVLTFDQLAQDLVYGKIASEIYNQTKKIIPLRHVGVRKSKLISWPGMEAVTKKETAAA